jgi:hypothetical protein
MLLETLDSLALLRVVAIIGPARSATINHYFAVSVNAGNFVYSLFLIIEFPNKKY